MTRRYQRTRQHWPSLAWASRWRWTPSAEDQAASTVSRLRARLQWASWPARCSLLLSTQIRARRSKLPNRR